MIEGISHITLVVKNLESSSNFLKGIFDAKEVYSSGEKQFSISKEKFFLIADIWICLMEGDSLCERTYNHIALKVHENDFDVYVNRIEKYALEIRPCRSRISGEGRSVYFYDYDNHLFELHTGTLENRLETYSNI